MIVAKRQQPLRTAKAVFADGNGKPVNYELNKDRYSNIYVMEIFIRKNIQLGTEIHSRKKGHVSNTEALSPLVM